jgi:hypothetical protein
MAYTHDDSGSTYTASNRYEMLTHIEELLGSEGTRELAMAMFNLLRDSNYITFDGQTFTMTPVTGGEWEDMLVRADDSL